MAPMELIRDTVGPMAQNLGLGGRGAHLVIPSLIGPILATVLVFNRVYWRISLVHTLALDDLCITLSLVGLSHIPHKRRSHDSLTASISGLPLSPLHSQSCRCRPRLWPACEISLHLRLAYCAPGMSSHGAPPPSRVTSPNATQGQRLS